MSVSVSRAAVVGWMVLLVGLCAAGAAGVSAGADARPAPPAAAGLPFEKYSLANGLTVILHEDRARPVAAIHLLYRVGARNEASLGPGRSGFAHLFEHLMFMGTRRVPNGEFDTIMEAGGGSNNANTSLDRTVYFSSGPAELLPTLLWLDADRMEDLGSAMDESKLNKQRDVVRNEIRQNVENTPYGRAYEWSFRWLYPDSHPYHHAVYGSHADLEAATVLDVKDFFARYYVPNNCTLVVAGDFRSDEVRPLIEKLYGSIPAGAVAVAGGPDGRGGASASIAARGAAPAALTQPRIVTLLDKVELPKVIWVAHSPAAYTEGDAAWQLLAQVLADGNNSRLYQRLVVRDGTAVEVSARQESASLGSVLRLEVTLKPEAGAGAARAAVLDELARLAASEAGGLSEAELSRRKLQVEAALVGGLQDLVSRADRMNEYNEYFGTPDGLARDVARYRAQTPASVAQAARELMRSVASGLEIRVLPEAPERAASARDARPELAPAGAWVPPAPETFKLASGVTVHLWSRPGLPLYSLAAVLRPPGEGAIDGAAQAGRAALLAEMLSQGTRSPALDAGGFAGALQEAGASFDASADRAGLVASVSGLASGFEAAAALWAGAITAPRLDGADFERERALRVKALLQAQEEPAAVASAVASRMLMGDGHPYSRPVAGTPATVGALTPEAVSAAYTSLADPARTEVFVVGALDRARVESALAPTLGRWTGAGAVGAATAASVQPPAERAGMTLVVVDRPGAVQTVIRWAAGGPRFADASRTPVELANIVLGGSFTSRLNQNLRERNGYTYGARSGLRADRSLGTFTAGTSVETRVTGPALREFLSELRGLAGGNLTADELTKARRTARTNVLEALGTAEGMARLAAGRVLDGADWAGLASELSRAEAVTLSEANAAAKAAPWLTRGVLVLVGDRREIVDALSKQQGLDLPAPVFVDAEGEPVRAPEPGR